MTYGGRTTLGMAHTEGWFGTFGAWHSGRKLDGAQCAGLVEGLNSLRYGSEVSQIRSAIHVRDGSRILQS